MGRVACAIVVLPRQAHLILEPLEKEDNFSEKRGNKGDLTGYSIDKPHNCEKAEKATSSIPSPILQQKSLVQGVSQAQIPILTLCPPLSTHTLCHFVKNSAVGHLLIWLDFLWQELLHPP